VGLDEVREEARRRGWPEKLVEELASRLPAMLEKLLSEGYEVREVKPGEVVRIEVGLGCWWRVVFGDVDVEGFEAYRAGQVPMSVYRIVLRPGTLVQYCAEPAGPLKAQPARILYYCPPEELEA